MGLFSSLVFQFHKGTIKTNHLSYRDLDVLYFNSIKVQLRQDRASVDGSKSLFQFHKGTIKTRTFLVHDWS